MKDERLLERITIDPGVMVGKPVIRGTRLTVEHILNLLAHGATEAEILEEYQGLTKADLQACILFATRCLEDAAFMPISGAPGEFTPLPCREMTPQSGVDSVDSVLLREMLECRGEASADGWRLSAKCPPPMLRPAAHETDSVSETESVWHRAGAKHSLGWFWWWRCVAAANASPLHLPSPEQRQDLVYSPLS